MFTGLIDDLGIVEKVVKTEAGTELTVRSGYTGLVPGESIALNGACLTVREFGEGWFTVAAAVTTLPRTTIADWKAGDSINLERAMVLGERLGGHIVQGHVDEVAIVSAVHQKADALIIDIQVSPELSELMVPHGSITIDGVSLTINDIPAPNTVQVSIIEYTRRHTTFGGFIPGRRVHVEADVIGKFVRQLVKPYQGGR